MSAERRPPTSADVARAAGVSRSTVSYVLNDTPGARVTDATRDRVLAAATELGYVPHAAAADLRRGTSQIVLGLLDQGRADSVAMHYIPSLTYALHQAGLTLVTAVVSGEVGEQEAQRWAALRPMAIVGSGARLAPEARKVFAAAGCVVISDYDADIPVTTNQAAFATAGAQALLDRGRSRILQVLPAEESLAELTADRVAAFEMAAGKRSLGTVRIQLRPPDAGELVAALLRRPEPPDGIVAHNDEYAALILGALLDAGVAVPSQVAVLGSDDSPWGRWLRPALSTLVVEAEPAVGPLVAALRAVRAGEPLPRAVLLDPRIRVQHRQTT